jgi:hypothetical protein
MNLVQRRNFLIRFLLSIGCVVLAVAMAPSIAAAQERIGILMLHG